MRDMYRRFGVAEGIFSRLSFIVRILLANSDALKCRVARRLCEGIQALKPPLQKPQLWGGEIGSPTVSVRFVRHRLSPTTQHVRTSLEG